MFCDRDYVLYVCVCVCVVIARARGNCVCVVDLHVVQVMKLRKQGFKRGRCVSVEYWRRSVCVYVCVCVFVCVRVDFSGHKNYLK